jgi:hypothetical protein
MLNITEYSEQSLNRFWIILNRFWTILNRFWTILNMYWTNSEQYWTLLNILNRVWTFWTWTEQRMFRLCSEYSVMFSIVQNLFSNVQYCSVHVQSCSVMFRICSVMFSIVQNLFSNVQYYSESVQYMFSNVKTLFRLSSTKTGDPKLPFSLLLSNYPSIPNYSATFDLCDLLCSELVSPLTTTYAISAYHHW